MSNTRVRIPELDAAVLGTAEHPVAMGRESDTEDKVLVALKCADALAARCVSGPEARRCGELPHLDSLVERTTDESTT